MSENIIIGAGLTGLSFAYFSKRPYVILEKDNKIGGLCGSIESNGFTYDYSGHFLHIHKEETKKLLNKILSGKLKNIERNSYVYTHNVYLPYPFQANLYNLPDKIKKECLLGFLSKPNLSYVPFGDFIRWSVANFGYGITKHFMKPYNEKLWTVSGHRLTSDWVAPFIPKPNLKDVITGAFNTHTKRFGYNSTFFYPKKGGCQTIVNAFAKNTKNIMLSACVKKINYRKKYVETSNGEKIFYENLISTQPLVNLLEQLIDAPSNIKEAKKTLLWNSVCCLNLGIKSDNIADSKHWIYFPEKKFIFYRLGFYSNVMSSMAPKECSSIYAEISHRPDKSVKNKSTFSRVLDGLIHSGIISKKDKFESINWTHIPYAYVIYDKNRTQSLKIIQDFLVFNNIYSIGRYGAWKYSFMEESINDGRILSKKINLQKYE